MQVTMKFSYSNCPQNWAQQTSHRIYRQERKGLINNRYCLPISTFERGHSKVGTPMWATRSKFMTQI